MPDLTIAQLADQAAPALTDLAVLGDPAGLANPKKITLANLFAADPNRASVGEKAALVGTSGAPSAINPFVTHADVRLADARTPLAHTHDVTTAEITGILPVEKGGTGAGAFTVGSIPYVGAAGVYSQDNANFFWDATNKRLGLGIAVPLARVHLKNTAIGATGLLIDSEITSTTTKLIELRRGTDNYSFFRLYVKSGAGVVLEADAAFGLRIYCGPTFEVRDNPTGDLRLFRVTQAPAWADSLSATWLQLGNATYLHTVLQGNTLGRLQMRFTSVQISSADATTTAVPVAMVEVHSDTTTKIVAIIKAKAAQTADLTQWRDSAGVPLTAIGPSGIVDAPAYKVGGAAGVSGTGTTITCVNGIVTAIS
jgi:hypothetical protein